MVYNVETNGYRTGWERMRANSVWNVLPPTQRYITPATNKSTNLVKNLLREHCTNTVTKACFRFHRTLRLKTIKFMRYVVAFCSKSSIQNTKSLESLLQFPNRSDNNNANRFAINYNIRSTRLPHNIMKHSMHYNVFVTLFSFLFFNFSWFIFRANYLLY